MANDFWSRAINGVPAAPQPSAPSYAPPGAYPPPSTPQQPPAPQHGFQNQHGYAVDIPVQAQQEAETAQHILNEGFLQTPPKWIQNQAQDRCPECNSANYAQQSGMGDTGRYGGTIRVGGNKTAVTEFVFKRCFNCGYATTHGQLNQFQGLNGGGPVVGSARQTDRGGAVYRHTGIIPV